MVSVTVSIDMDFEFFEKLSRAEANAFLKRFLDEESSNIKGTMKQCAAAGVKLDYSIKSISPFMRWVLKQLIVTPVEPDPEVPEWLRKNDSYTTRLFEFNESSKELVLQAAYYLGESFVRSHDTLHWGSGDITTAEGNMPVVIGFQHELELAPILVANNLLRRITAEPQKSSRHRKSRRVVERRCLAYLRSNS